MFNQTIEDTSFIKPTREFSYINNLLVFIRHAIRYPDTVWDFKKTLPPGKYHDGFNGTFWNYDH